MYAYMWYDYPRGTGTKHKEYSKWSNPEPRFIQSTTLVRGFMTNLQVRAKMLDDLFKADHDYKVANRTNSY